MPRGSKQAQSSETVSLEGVDHIGVSNILDIRTYSIRRVGDRIQHLLEFNDGGRLELKVAMTMPKAATLVVLRGERVAVQRVGNGLFVGQIAKTSDTPTDGNGTASGSKQKATRH
jgi:hypothetical protein